MFSKSLLVCLLAVSLVKPNEAVFGFDVVVEGAVDTVLTNANSITQIAANASLTLLRELQSTVQSATNSLTTEIVAVVNGAIDYGVTAVGGSQTKIANCTRDNQASITAFEINSLKSIIQTCLTNDIETTIFIISGISSAVNTITNTVVGIRPRLNTTCPAPAAGDILGAAANCFCGLTTVATISVEIGLQGAIISLNIQQASALVTKISAITAVVPACVSAQISVIGANTLPAIAPVVQCTLF